MEEHDALSRSRYCTLSPDSLAVFNLPLNPQTNQLTLASIHMRLSHLLTAGAAFLLFDSAIPTTTIKSPVRGDPTTKNSRSLRGVDFTELDRDAHEERTISPEARELMAACGFYGYTSFYNFLQHLNEGSKYIEVAKNHGGYLMFRNALHKFRTNKNKKLLNPMLEHLMTLHNEQV
ncbi:hypothetical protein PsorP6_007319 [Peronosclerospora sorghi]|uniref:Uncharacterized protein n=1 Tax=Peronosclerospora sorghi TaxID=230839 RepID=A0ACC0WCS5_9STRA|nr:hypothetical protein PsorP6_007319 [Peronosclerospora sorghi]